MKSRINSTIVFIHKLPADVIINKVLREKRQVIVFLCGGILSAIVDIGTLQLMVSAGMPVSLAATAGFATGLMVNYVFHAKITFQRAAVSTNFIRYSLLVALNYLVTLICVTLASILIGMPIIGKIVSLPLVACNTFLLGKYWVFR